MACKCAVSEGLKEADLSSQAQSLGRKDPLRSASSHPTLLRRSDLLAWLRAPLSTADPQRVCTPLPQMHRMPWSLHALSHRVL